MKDVNKLTKIALLLSFAIILSYFESLIPIPFPGVKLGLANFIGLIILFSYSKKDYIYFNVLKVLINAILFNGFGITFLISLSGTLLAVISTLLIYKFSKASIYGISVNAACFHSIGQILMVSLIYSNIYMINYLPLLIITSSIGGFLMASLSVVLLKNIPLKKYKQA